MLTMKDESLSSPAARIQPLLFVVDSILKKAFGR